MDTPPEFWRKCSTCKQPIGFRSRFWICSVSTCNRKATSYVFCSVPCWDAHVPMMNHREAWAEEKTSPTRDEWLREKEAERAAEIRAAGALPRSAGAAHKATPDSSIRKTVTTAHPESGSAPTVLRRIQGDPQAVVYHPATGATEGKEEGPMESATGEPEEILVVASKLKSYIRARSGMNTSASVLDVLSDRLREMCDRAIEVARREDRKTVLDRDFE